MRDLKESFPAEKSCPAVHHLKPEHVARHTSFLDLGIGVSDGTCDY